MTLHHVVEGPIGAATVLLVPGIGTTADLWAPCVGALAEGLRVTRVDLPGHGHSAPTGASSIAEIGAELVAVLDALDVERAHVVGLSLGGMAALWMAVHHPERVARVAAVCTSLQPDRARFVARAAAVRADGTGSVAATSVARWITPDLAGRDQELVARLTAAVEEVDDESYARCCEAIAGLDLVPDLGRIAVPTLVIAGADDRAAPPGDLRAIADAIADARFEVVADAAHCAPLEQPGAVVALVREHLLPPATGVTGMATRRAVLGDAHVDRSIGATVPFTADFQDFLTRYAWGEVWSRPGLSRRERSLVTLGVLVALGAEAEISMHVRAAITNGLSPAEIAEVLQHTALYAGLPRANAAFALARQVLTAIDGERGDA